MVPNTCLTKAGFSSRIQRQKWQLVVEVFSRTKTWKSFDPAISSFPTQKHFRAVGVVKVPAFTSPNPIFGEQGDNRADVDWYANVEYEEFEEPVQLESHLQEVIPLVEGTTLPSDLSVEPQRKTNSVWSMEENDRAKYIPASNLSEEEKARLARIEKDYGFSGDDGKTGWRLKLGDDSLTRYYRQFGQSWTEEMPIAFAQLKQLEENFKELDKQKICLQGIRFRLGVIACIMVAGFILWVLGVAGSFTMVFGQ